MDDFLPHSFVNVVRSQLTRTAGITPSDDWLKECLVSLRQQHGDTTIVPQRGAEEVAALVLQQILYHNLRDVVRTMGTTNEMIVESVQPTINTDAAPIQLRKAIQESRNGVSLSSSPRKAILPESFRLLVQVEESVDVSSNVENRLGMTIDSKTHENRQQQQQHPYSSSITNNKNQCLKIAYSDGYFTSGISFVAPNTENSNLPSTNNNTLRTQHEPNTLIAMTVSPLVMNSSTNGVLTAGVKVLLHGSITIRHGIAGWHAGNATVLGGCVQSLVQVQQQAMALARQRAGHGIDPTIRALIGNGQPTNTEEGNDDEAEHESRDVTLSQPPPPRQSISISQPQYLPQQSASQSIPTSTSNNTNPYTMSAPRTNTIVQDSTPVAQPATNLVGTISSSVPSLTKPLQQKQQPPPQQTHQSLLQNESTNFATTSEKLCPLPSINPYSISTMVDSMGESSTHSNSTSATKSQTHSIALDLPSHAHEQHQYISFAQLHDLIARAVVDPALYHVLCARTYVVSLQQVGHHLHFNIVKTKHKKKSNCDKDHSKSEKQYEYTMNAKFRGSALHEEPITCRVATTILEPFFAISPTEMRKLNKTDRPRSDAMVSEGGKELRRCTVQLNSYVVTMEQSPNDFFSEIDTTGAANITLNGTKPILFLQERLL